MYAGNRGSDKNNMRDLLDHDAPLRRGSVREKSDTTPGLESNSKTQIEFEKKLSAGKLQRLNEVWKLPTIAKWRLKSIIDKRGGVII